MTNILECIAEFMKTDTAYFIAIALGVLGSVFLRMSDPYTEKEHRAKYKRIGRIGAWITIPLFAVFYACILIFMVYKVDI